MITKLLKSIFISFIFCTSSVFAAPSLLFTSSGILTGASGVIVDGSIYDVQFSDESCSTLFNGCVTSAFTFHDAQSAQNASSALLDQVLGPNHINYQLIAGCGDPAACDLTTPFNFIQSTQLVNVAYLYYKGGSDSFVSTSLCCYAMTNLKDSYYMTYVKWTPSPVPVPTSAWLFGSGLVGLVTSSRRRKSN